MDAGEYYLQQEQQAGVPSFLKNKEYREMGEEGERRRRSPAACLLFMVFLVLSSIHAGCSPAHACCLPVVKACKTPLNPPNARSPNKLRLSGLTKPGATP